MLRPLLLLTTVEAFAYYTLTNVLTLHLTDVLGIGDAVAGMHFGFRGTVTMLFSTLVGPLIDCLGPLRVLPAAFALAAIGRAAFALADSPGLALFAMYVPMAAGHGMTNAALTICVKQATAQGTGPSSVWGFAMQYCALVLGIALCGPTIDLVTASLSPRPPYRQLALLSAGCSALGLCISLAVARASAHVIVPPPTRWRDGDRRAGIWKMALDWLRHTVLTRRFARFAAYSIAILPASSVLRNLDGGIFPKFMVRSFGASVPKGTIYALNPLIDLVAVPLASTALRHYRHFSLIRAGLTAAALSPLVVRFAGASLHSVVAFVLVLTLADVLYNPRLQAYAMAVAPDGREGSFAGAMHAVAFLAEVPAGMLGGWLIQRHCPEGQAGATGSAASGGCDARNLFGELGLFALLSPLALWSFPSLLREPDADVCGGQAQRGEGRAGLTQSRAICSARRRCSSEVRPALSAGESGVLSADEEVDALVSTPSV